MKTNILYRLAAFAAALAALACSSDDTVPEPSGPDNPDKTAPYTITASFDDQTPETRISMTDDGTTKIELAWKDGDKIYVVNSDAKGSTSAGTLYTFTVVAGSISPDGKSATFGCENFPADATPAYALHQGNDTFSSFNPTSVGLTYSFSASDLQNNFPLYATFDAATRQFTFRPMVALLKLKVTLPAGVAGNVSSIRIGSSDDAKIFYDSTYDITSGTAVRTGNTLLNNIGCSGYESLTGGTETAVYLPIKPGAELAGQPLDIYLMSGNMIYFASIRGGMLEAGKCYPLTLGAAKWSGERIYEGGTGYERNPYQIRNEANLRALARSVRAGNNYLDKYFRLTTSISGIVTSESDPWLPIGTEHTWFYGHFNGGGYTVSGIFHLSDKDGRNLGFFGEANFGSIKNLTIEGDVIYRGDLNAEINIGGIAGYCNAIVSNCSHKGSVTAENAVTTRKFCVGGIAGMKQQEFSGCTQSGGTITANAPNATTYAGGIAGQFTGTMHTCRNESDLMITGNSYTRVGALAGYLISATVYDCSTFRSDLTVTVNGTQQNPVKEIGGSFRGTPETTPCEDASHTPQQ